MYANTNSSLPRFEVYTEEDSGRWGKATERSIKLYFNQLDKVARPGRVDFRRAHTCYEVKTGAGEIDSLLNSKLKYVLYIPVVNEAMPIEKQEGFLLSRTDFLDILDNLGLIRSKISSAGIQKVTIQTFWNHSKNKPHGAKYYSLLDACYETCLMTLEDFLQNNGKIEEEG